MKQTLSIKDTRNHLAEIINRVSITGESFVVTKFGKAKAKIVPMIDAFEATKKQKAEEKKKAKLRQALRATFGMWADREDMKDPEAWVENLRKPRFRL